MTTIALPSITLLYAAAFALLNLWLSVRVATVRIKGGTMDGHGGDGSLLHKRGRAHANFNEYVPIALVLMLVLELRVGHAAGLWALGAALIVGRLLHPFGLERPAPNPFRMAGILLTWLATLGLALWAIYLAFQPGPAITYF
ncbi:MAPEG family protein [Sphingomonas naphthae]|uniref:MAPEG family protein n=1 Tax=Sphingomonas naphthae TaxID=1813468 RepID=A0ABY7TL89_9SPHN|nr:MAPEG family protein [Sphingomonas naphthae]WCT73150.1 MAPEG family protein [Sphingomonas naphthae]